MEMRRLSGLIDIHQVTPGLKNERILIKRTLAPNILYDY